MSNSTVVIVAFSILLLSSCRPQPPAVELYEIFHSDTRGWAHDIAVEGTDVYVADRQGGFLVFDGSVGFRLAKLRTPVKDVISLAPNSGMPVLASRYEGVALTSRAGSITDRYSTGDIANAVEIRGELAFAAYGLQGLVVMRVENGRAAPIATLSARGWSHDLRLSRNQALLADWSGLRIVDISQPANPAEVAFLPSPATCVSLAVKEAGEMRRLALAEGHAGVAFVSLDVNGRPSLLGRHHLGLNPTDPIHPDSGGWVHSVAWAGRYVFAANWKRGLALLDAENPQKPELMTEYSTRGTALAVKTQLQQDGTYLVYLADGEAGLRIFRFKGAQ